MDQYNSKGRATCAHNKAPDSLVDLKLIILQLLAAVRDEEYKFECTLRFLAPHFLEMSSQTSESPTEADDPSMFETKNEYLTVLVVLDPV